MNGRRYRPIERDAVIRYYPDLGSVPLSRALNRSKVGIKQLAGRLGLKRKYRNRNDDRLGGSARSGKMPA